MPTRMLRDGILSSERIAAIGWLEEVFYRRLMSVVDDYGRYYAHHSLLRAACYPLQLEKVSDSDVGKWLRVTEKAGLVRVYPAPDGKRYLELLDFGQRIQGKSKFPPPTGVSPESTVVHGESPESTVENRLVVVVVEDEDEGVSRKRGKPCKKPIPADFAVTARVQEWADGKGFDNLQAHLEHFTGIARANGYGYVDWDEAFMRAVRDDWAKLRIPKSGASSRKRVDL